MDQALKTLREHGVDRALVEGGGDVAVSEPPPGKKGWRFELSSIDATNAPAARYLSLKKAAISTSGDLYQRLEIDGKRYSHIIDPRRGAPAERAVQVTVLAPRAIDSEVWAKPYFIQDRAWTAAHKPKSWRVLYCENIPGTACSWVE